MKHMVENLGGGPGGVNAFWKNLKGVHRFGFYTFIAFLLTIFSMSYVISPNLPLPPWVHWCLQSNCLVNDGLQCVSAYELTLPCLLTSLAKGFDR